MSTAATLLTADELDQFPDDGKRREIIGGELHVSPSAARGHQALSMHLSMILYRAIYEADAGEVFATPDVRFSETDQVQPDIVVISSNRLGNYEGHIMHGAPEIVVEILSPSNTRYDLIEKRQLYETNGVPEYWIVDPVRKMLVILRLENGVYAEVVPENGLLQSTAIVDFTIDPSGLFAKVMPE